VVGWKMTNVLPCLSNIVTASADCVVSALANGVMLRVVGWKMSNELQSLSNVTALANGTILCLVYVMTPLDGDITSNHQNLSLK
jgi:hypothetical protein